MKYNEKIIERSIQDHETLFHAMELMDRVRAKLVLVFNGEEFKGLLSIGDIQRAIINNYSFDTKIHTILRKDIIVAYEHEDEITIKNKLLELRAECMPIVDTNGRLVNVTFWEDLFPSKKKSIFIEPKIPVVVMAGGLGTRLRPLTYIIPKPLIPISNKTILEEIIKRFENIGSTEFYLSVNYKYDVIKYYFESIENKKYTIEYIKEEKPLGTAGSLYLLKGKIQSTFFVTNCDILVDEDYNEIYQYHKKNKNDITLVASIKKIKIPYGTVESGENGELTALKEKPELIYMINTGMYILEPHVLELINENHFIHITDLIEQIKSTGGSVGVFPVSEKSWTDIGEWSEYQKIIEQYK
jgi:dTDP-glucose pyrophosphorylase